MDQKETFLPSTPLAERMRPLSLDDFIGQSDSVGPGSSLRKMIEQDRISSLILWGPPGCGKTTLAKLLARYTSANFISFSAVTSGVKEVRRIIEEAANIRKLQGSRSILFVDELHRFNKSQQDAFLPAVEDGTIALVGATTENPSFEINTPLLSRSKVIVFKQLSNEEIITIVENALADEQRGLGNIKTSFAEGVLFKLAEYSDGDARVALNLLEMVVLTADENENGIRQIKEEHLESCLGRKFISYDKSGEEHYNLISALHKSMRNSDPDATMYWLGRMLESGEEPLYVIRRIIRFASEDIGMADPRALQVAVAAQQAVHFLGMPEGNLALAEAAVYMATAPKSNALYVGYKEVQKDIQRTRDEPVPMQIRNAVTKLMKDVGYGHGYKYAHDYPEAMSDLQCLPDSLKNRKYYKPSNRGFERNIQERMAFLAKLRKELRK